MNQDKKVRKQQGNSKFSQGRTENIGILLPHRKSYKELLLPRPYPGMQISSSHVNVLMHHILYLKFIKIICVMYFIVVYSNERREGEYNSS